jgi:hypothetical protein
MNDHAAVGAADEQEHYRSARPRTPRPRGRGWIVSVFGDIMRSGSWPSRRTTPVAVFGDIDLDLRQAELPPGEVIISAVAPFGNIDVLVPDGTRVELGGFAVFGSKKVAVTADDNSTALMRVRGYTLFGSVKVWSP